MKQFMDENFLLDTKTAQRALASTFPTRYLYAAKTTILKIGKPNYRF